MSNPHLSSRLVIFILLLLLLSLYTQFRLRQLLPSRQITSWVLSALTVALSWSWLFIYQSNPSYVELGWFQILCWAGSISLGIWATFLILSLPIDLGTQLLALYQKLSSNKRPDPLRREVLSRWTSLAALGLSGGIGALGFRTAILGPRIVEASVPIKNLHQELVGLKIVQISDLHIGTTIQRKSVEDIVNQILKLKPDLIAVTGDLADGKPEILARYLEPFSKLKAPLGVYFVTGNHEYYWGAEDWIQKTREIGFIPLLNENRILDFKGAKLLIGGVPDTSSHDFLPSHKSDPHQAIQSDSPYPIHFKMLLAHRPNSCEEAEKAGFQLQLSGHTHGGQFFPWSLFIPLAHKYYRGLNQHKKMWVYVNSGTGYWGPPNRFQIPSEITLIHLATDTNTAKS